MRFCPEDMVRTYRSRVEQMRPVVQCITNIVTVNDCANALLAVGASPTMAHHPEEMADFAAFTDALVLNLGATESLEAMMGAGLLAREKGHPVVLDPVGCAGSAFRRERCLELIREVKPSCIRGNASEIRALLHHVNTGKGVDERVHGTSEKERESFADLHEEVKELSKQTGAIVIASGETDLLAYQGWILEVHAGSAWMSKVTGCGCMLSALLGGFLAAECSLESAWACCTYMAKCGEEAERRMIERGGGSGTYHIALMDALSLGGGDHRFLPGHGLSGE